MLLVFEKWFTVAIKDGESCELLPINEVTSSYRNSIPEGRSQSDVVN